MHRESIALNHQKTIDMGSMIYQELDSLITFKMKLPSLYHIMLGMSEDETVNYQDELDSCETDNYDLNDFLKKYGIIVSRNALSEFFKLKDISFAIPIYHLTEWDIKMIFDTLAFRMGAEETKYCISTGTKDTITDINSIIHTNLFDTKMIKWNNPDNEEDYLLVSFVVEDDTNLDKLRALSVISNYDKGFAEEIIEYVKQNY